MDVEEVRSLLCSSHPSGHGSRRKLNSKEVPVGTRHITAVVSEGQFVVAQYGQWDGYPTGAGNDIVAIISGKIDQLKASLKHIVPVDSGMFEIYQGFQIHPSENRFSSMFEGAINGYYPPKLVATYPLDELPTDSQLQRLESL